jgi:hypothetical protein
MQTQKPASTQETMVITKAIYPILGSHFHHIKCKNASEICNDKLLSKYTVKWRTKVINKSIIERKSIIPFNIKIGLPRYKSYNYSVCDQMHR